MERYILNPLREKSRPGIPLMESGRSFSITAKLLHAFVEKILALFIIAA